MSNVIQLFSTPVNKQFNAYNHIGIRRQQRRRSSELKELDKNYISAGCRWYVRLKVYKGIHFWFDPKTLEARSYQWFPMLLKIGKRLVINECIYSNQTAKDYSKLHRCLEREKIKPDCSIYAPQGLNNLDAALSYYEYEIKSRQELILKPRTHKRKNAERKIEIKQLNKKLKLVISLIKSAAKAA